MAKKRHARKPRSDTRNWSELVRENAAFESYYKSLHLFPEDEWQAFKTSCQTDLPLTFRITGSRKHADEILTLFEENHLKNLSNIEFEGEMIKPPKRLTWYPNGLAWQLDVSKKVLRKNEQFAKTQRFLVLETGTGNISRQEAVSMIPPLILDVQSHHSVLDMCAAPGSKTAQLIEALHKDTDEPTGFIIANDSDTRRSYMLVHQLKRLNSPHYLVLNHDAQFFPRISMDSSGSKKGSLKFDRILCDVPCSGDGTMRKNFNVWKDWNNQNALGLHLLQFNILNRGIQLLKSGGKLVYSTCSMNPIENEAVIAHALRKWGKKIRLVQTDMLLPNLIRSKGISTWPVINKQSEVKQKGDQGTIDSWFPPTEEEAKEFNLDYCMRVYPHQQNTGGFFIAMLEKLETVPENDIEQDFAQQPINEPKKKKETLPLDANDEPFRFVSPEHHALKKCWEFYGIDEKFDNSTCMIRSLTPDHVKVIFSTDQNIKKIIEFNEDKLKLIYTGVKFLVHQRDDIDCPWRIHSECLPTLKHHINSDRIITGNSDLLKLLLQEPFPTLSFIRSKNVDNEFVDRCEKLSSGCGFISISRNEPNKEDLFLPFWKGVKALNVMVAKENVHELLYRVFNIETKASDNPMARKAENAPGRIAVVDYVKDTSDLDKSLLERKTDSKVKKDEVPSKG